MSNVHGLMVPQQLFAEVSGFVPQYNYDYYNVSKVSESTLDYTHTQSKAN